MNAPPTAKLPLRASDLRGLSRLGFDAVGALTGVVESMHGAIASRANLVGAAPALRTTGTTARVYRTVRGVTGLCARGVDAVWGAAGAHPTERGGAPSPQRDAALAALNGLWGDHLEATHNPLALPMTWRVHGHALRVGAPGWASALGSPTPNLLVLVHGLCMSERQWLHRGHDHGQALARAHGYTPVYLSYNSGRHVSVNGRELAAQLELLVRAWPQPVRQLALLGHSMGGLLARSACQVAHEQGLAWRGALTKLAFLGTPHHGAPLERGGGTVEALMGWSPYVAPLARLTRARSAGITDLRYGNVQDADWQGRDRHAQHRDDRVPTPLPEGVALCVVAATRAPAPARARAGGVPERDARAGDGLVPLASALGDHPDPRLALRVPRDRRHVVSGCGHLELLSDTRVGAVLGQWLATPGRR